MNYLNRIELQNFKSIRELDLELGNLNILIGANGAGKSNFVNFFKMLEAISAGRFAEYVGLHSGHPGFFFYGNSDCGINAKLTMHLKNKQFAYQFTLKQNPEEQLVFTQENIIADEATYSLGIGHRESHLNCDNHGGLCRRIAAQLTKWQVFQFHETSQIRGLHYIHDNLKLRENSANLAPYLLVIKEKYPSNYRRIIRTIQQIIPYFGDFVLDPLRLNSDNNRLDWRELATNLRFSASQFSDGSLRFAALTTLLMQPLEMMPSLILIDEPELGLHPAAIRLLASMIKAASENSQIILATQSKTLVDEFEPKDIIVLERNIDDSEIHFCSSFRRLDPCTLENWLEDYGMGEIWDKDIIGGRP
ncbi:MAG: AAA family ATPase [Victivallaceae bacterium]